MIAFFLFPLKSYITVVFSSEIAFSILCDIRPVRLLLFLFRLSIQVHIFHREASKDIEATSSSTRPTARQQWNCIKINYFKYPIRNGEERGNERGKEEGRCRGKMIRVFFIPSMIVSSTSADRNGRMSR